MSSGSSNNNNNSNEKLSFTIRLSNGTRWSLELPSLGATVENTTVLHVKQQLSTQQEQEYVSGVPVANLRLIYKGRILENDRVLSDYGILPKATLFVVKSAARSSNASNNSGGGAVSRAPVAAPTSAPPPFNPWGSNSNNNNNAFPQQPPNPEQMQQVLNNPLFQNMLDSNPDFLRNMMQQQMQNNPAMQQVMDANPAMRHMLNDPAAWDQAMQMMRNPAALQQALRSQDLAMSQLENMPGGMAALQNMYQQYQQPLEEATQMGGAATTSSGAGGSSNASSPSDTTAGASGQAMPNPWGSSTSTVRNNNTSGMAGTTTSNAANNNSNPWSSTAAGANNNNNMDFSNANSLLMGAGLGGTGAGLPPTTTITPAQRQQALRMLDNPVLQNAMQQALQQNPEFFRHQLLAQNPALGQIMSPQELDRLMQEMMQPDNMRAMMQMQEQMQNIQFAGASSNNANGSSPANAFGAAAAANPFASGGLDFGSLLSSSGGGPPSQAQPQSPADRYAHQLQSLYGMGFDDEQRNLAALQAAHGNLNRAVDSLLEAAPPAAASAESNNATTAAEGEQTNDDDNNNNTSNEPPKSVNDKKND